MSDFLTCIRPHLTRPRERLAGMFEVPSSEKRPNQTAERHHRQCEDSDEKAIWHFSKPGILANKLQAITKVSIPTPRSYWCSCSTTHLKLIRLRTRTSRNKRTE